jgi:hypothetical protein
VPQTILATIIFARHEFFTGNARFWCVFRGFGADSFLIFFCAGKPDESMYVDAKPAKHVANAPRLHIKYA